MLNKNTGLKIQDCFYHEKFTYTTGKKRLKKYGALTFFDRTKHGAETFFDRKKNEAETFI